jgi:hypothetical protein
MRAMRSLPFFHIILSLFTLLMLTTVNAQAYPFAGSWHGVGVMDGIPSSVDLIMSDKGRYAERVLFSGSVVGTLGQYFVTKKRIASIFRNVIIFQPVVWNPVLGTPSMPLYIFQFTSNNTMLLESFDFSTILRFKRIN